MINPYIVHPELLGKYCRPVGVSRPTPAHRQVKNQEKGVVVNPCGTRGNRRGSPAGVKNIVNVKINLVRLPVDREGVVGILEKLASGKSVVGRNSRASGIARPVNGAVGFPLFSRFSDIFHYIHFAAGGPPHGADVGSQHPERGPDSLAVGKFHAGFNPAVLKGLFAGG